MKSIFSLLTILCFSNLSFPQNNGFEINQKNTMDGPKYGVIKNGVQVISMKYDVISNYSFGKFSVVDNDKVGVLDTLNQIIIPFKYSFIADYMGDITFLSTDQKLAMADSKGKILTPFEYDDVLGYQNGIARVVIGDKIAYVNNKGEMIIPAKFNEGYDCYGNFILVYTDSWKSLGYNYVQKDFFGNVIDKGEVGMSGELPIIFDKNGEILYRGKFGEKVKITPNEKLAVAERYLEMGTREINIIDATGEVLHTFNGRTSASIKDKWIRLSTNTGAAYKVGIIDFDGKMVLKQNFSDITDYFFNRGTLAKVKFPNGEFFYIDKNINCVEFEGQSCPEKS